MPAIGNITVKKSNGTTDVVYTQMQPSSGDGTSAVWRCVSVGTAPSHGPEFRLMGKEGLKGKARALRSTFVYPQIATNTTTGVTSIVERAFAATDWTVPKDMSASDINEFAAQYANLLASAMIYASVQSGFAPS